MFYVGQEVVAVKDDFTPQGRGVLKGVSFIVKNIDNSCKCGTCIDVGISDVYDGFFR